MKISILSILFGAFSFSFDGTKNSSLVCASKNTIDPKAQTSTIAPLGFSANKISLVGLDTRQPLTKAEVAFLESTIQKALNNMYKELDMDRVVGEVIVDTVIDDDATSTTTESGSLRGSNRKLPWSDVEMCTYQEGPLKGEIIPGCEFDIDCYTWVDCHYCMDDDDDDWNPDYYREPLCHLCVDDDYWSHQQPTTWSPTQAPSKVPSQTPSQAPSNTPSNTPSKAPSKAPSNTPSNTSSNSPSAVPSLATSSIATEDNTIAVGVEEERGPDMPLSYFLPPPTPNPSQPPNMDPNLQILYDLQHSPFTSFQGITWVGFGGGWRI